MSDPEEHDREIKRHDALEILKNNEAALGEEPRELSPKVAELQNFYLDGLMALSSQEWKTRQRLHSGILAHLYKPEPDYKKFRDEASKVLWEKEVKEFRDNIILQTQILIEQREATENRRQKHGTRRKKGKKNDNSEEQKHNIEEFQPRLVRVPSDIQPDENVTSAEGDNDVPESIQLAEVIKNTSNYNPVSTQSDEIMKDQWNYDPASAQSDEVTMTDTKDYDLQPTRSQARNSISLAATSLDGPSPFTLRSGKQYNRDGNGKQLNGRARLPKKKRKKAITKSSKKGKNDQNQQQSSNENNRKRKAVDSDTSLGEASHNNTLSQLRKKNQFRHTQKKKLKLLSNQNGFNSISQPNRKRFNFTEEKLMKSASTWSSLIALISELRTAIEYFGLAEYERYHLYMISLILRACQCTDKEELDNIQEHLPGTISTMSVPIFEYLKKNAAEGNGNDFSKMIHIDFPADAGREEQERCIELWHSVLHNNHPAFGGDGRILPNLDHVKINLIDIYRGIVITEKAMKYRESTYFKNLSEDKEWLYDLQRRLVNKVLHTVVSTLNDENGSTLSDENGPMLIDQDSSRQTSINGQEECKQTSAFNLGSQSMFELGDNATLLFKTAQQIKKKLKEQEEKLKEQEEKLKEQEEKLKEQEENLGRERIEMRRNLQTDRDKMKRDMEDALNRIMEDALSRMMEDVQMGAAEGDQRRNAEGNLFPVEGSEDTEDEEEISPVTVALKKNVDALNKKIQEIQQESKMLNTEVEKAKDREIGLEAGVNNLRKEYARLESQLKELKENKAIEETESKEIIEEIMASFDREFVDENLANQPKAISQKPTEEEKDTILQHLRKLHNIAHIYHDFLQNRKRESKQEEKRKKEFADGAQKKINRLRETIGDDKSIRAIDYKDIKIIDPGKFEPISSNKRLQSALDSKVAEYTQLKEKYRQLSKVLDRDLKKREEIFPKLMDVLAESNRNDSQKEVRLSITIDTEMDSIVQEMKTPEVTSNTLTIPSTLLNKELPLVDVSIYIDKIKATERKMANLLKAFGQYSKRYDAMAKQLLEDSVRKKIKEGLQEILRIANTHGPEALQVLERELGANYTYQQIREQIHSLLQTPRRTVATITEQKMQVLYEFGGCMMENYAETINTKISKSEQRNHLLKNMRDQWEKANTAEVSGLRQKEGHDEPKSEGNYLDRLFAAITSLIELLGKHIEEADKLKFSCNSLEGSLVFLWDFLREWKEADYVRPKVNDQNVLKEKFTNYCQEQRLSPEEHEREFTAFCEDIQVLVQSRNNLKSVLQIFAEHQWKMNHQVVKEDLTGFKDSFNKGGLVAEYFKPNECLDIYGNIDYLQDIWPSNGLLEVDKTVILPRRKFEEARKPLGEAEEAAKWMDLARQFRSVNQAIYKTGQSSIYGKDAANLPWQQEDSVSMKIEKINVFFRELEKTINKARTNGPAHVPPSHTTEENTRPPTSSEESDLGMGGVRLDEERNAGGFDAIATDQTADEGTKKMANSQTEEAAQRDLISKIENVFQEFLSAKDIFVFNNAWLEGMLRKRDAKLLKELREHQADVTKSLLTKHELVANELLEHQASLVKELQVHGAKLTATMQSRKRDGSRIEKLQTDQASQAESLGTAHEFVTKKLLEHQAALVKELQKHDAQLTEVQLQNHQAHLAKELQKYQASVTESLLAKLLEHQASLTKELRSHDAKFTEVQLHNYQINLAEELQNHQANIIKELLEHQASLTEALRQPDANLIEELLQRYDSSLIEKLQNYQTNLMEELLQNYQASLSEPQPKLDFISKLEHIATELSQSNIQLLQLPSDMKNEYKKLLNRVESRERKSRV